MEKKLTAEEWLVSQIWKREPLEHEQKVIERAKEMEKEQKETLYTDEDLEKVWLLAVENTLLKALNKPIEKTYYQLLEEIKRK